MATIDDADATLAAELSTWRAELSANRALSPDDIDELEDHLLSEYTDLMGLGLSTEEAMLIARRRLGTSTAVAGEYLAVHPDRAWKQIGEENSRPVWHLPVALVLGLVAGLCARGFLEVSIYDHGEFALRAFPLIPLAFFAVYLAITAKTRDVIGLALVGVGLGAGGIIAAFYPSNLDGQTPILTGFHLPIFALVLIGIAYLGLRWRSIEAWMDWVRYVGEGAIYYTLTTLGGGIIVALVYSIFAAIGLDTQRVDQVMGWIVLICVVGALFVCAWLVEFKKSAMENVAPVLTAVFTPVMTVALVSFLFVVAITGNLIEVERDVLIVFDGLLIVVEALVMFTVSARPEEKTMRLLDWMQVVLIGAGVLVDVLLLWALSGRLVEYGLSANKLAALVLNILLLIHLIGALVGYLRIAGKRPSAALALVKWQALALPVFGVWAAIVAFIFPPVFSFA